MNGFVYFIQIGQEGPIKIGWTGRTVPLRIREHCAQHSHETIRFLGKIPGTKERERKIHDLFRKDMILPEELPEGLDPIKKSELFEPSPALVGYISRLQDKSLS